MNDESAYDVAKRLGHIVPLVPKSQPDGWGDSGALRGTPENPRIYPCSHGLTAGCSVCDDAPPTEAVPSSGSESPDA